MKAFPMRKRWSIYALIGFLFGILDWYFLDLLASVGSKLNPDNWPLIFQLFAVAVILALNWGIWLVPVIPVAIRETRHSGYIRLAALASVIVWSFAILSYYIYYTLLLLFRGLPHMNFMLYSNRHAPTYWQDWKPAFQRIILDQFFDWIGVAIIGGAIVGALTAILYRRLRNRKMKRAAATG
jgi:hypothetical protein